MVYTRSICFAQDALTLCVPWRLTSVCPQNLLMRGVGSESIAFDELSCALIAAEDSIIRGATLR